MMHSTPVTVVSQAVEVVSMMWAEVLMFGLAGCLYLFYVGSIRLAGKKSSKTKVPSVPTDQVDPVYQNIIQKIQEGNPASALELTSKLPSSAVSPLPAKVASSLLLGLSKNSELSDEAAQQLKALGKSFDAKGFETAAVQAVHGHSAEVCHRLLSVSRFTGVVKTERAVSLIVRGHSYDASTFLALIDEVTSDGSGVELTRTLLNDLLAVCKKYGDQEAMKLVQQRTPASAITEMTRHAKYISSCGKEGRLQDALEAFQAVKDSGAQLNTFIYNCMLDACIKCNDPKAAIAYFSDMQQSVAPDVVTYNTVMRAYLELEDADAVYMLVLEMRAEGIEPSRITYQALLHAVSQSGNRKELWRIVNEMQKADMHVGSFACNLLLKGITDRSQAEEMMKILAIIDAGMEADPSRPVMDGSNFILFMEACMKTNNLSLLWERMRMYCLQGSTVKLTAAMCGSLIKAYGQEGNVERVWQIWFTMASRQVKPSSVTLGCMVEALVANKCTSEALKLVNGIWDDLEQRPLINTVIYSNILKGFAYAKENEKVTMLYSEMTKRGIQCNTVSYNTILNCSALCGRMEEVPQLLADMKAADPPVVPDIVTYSTIIKGYCLGGQLDKGLELMEEMKVSAGLQPDEVMYNSVLDGCARQSRLETALKLLDEMKANGVKPSNFTLSIVCKLMGRTKNVDKAIEIVQTVSKENGFRPNIQVYTCLIQACIYNGKLSLALSLHDEVVSGGFCHPDEKTYSSMVRGYLQVRRFEQAVEVVRCAYHLPGHKLQETKGKPKGVQLSVVHDVIANLGLETPAARSLVNDLCEYRQIHVKQEDCKAAEAELRKRGVFRKGR